MTDKELVDMIVNLANVVQVLTGLTLEQKESESRDKAVNQLLNVIRMGADNLAA